MAALITDLRHWNDLNSFRWYLEGVPDRKPWHIRGITLHHTFVPTISQWRGMRTVKGLAWYYANVRRWKTGPHLFLAVGSPQLANDGLFQLTPLTSPGTHAGRCNTDHIGLEIVGNYNARPWPLPVYTATMRVLVMLCRRFGLDENDLIGHNECMALRTCPGSKVDMSAVRYELGKWLKVSPDLGIVP